MFTWSYSFLLPKCLPCNLLHIQATLRLCRGVLHILLQNQNQSKFPFVCIMLAISKLRILVFSLFTLPFFLLMSFLWMYPHILHDVYSAPVLSDGNLSMIFLRCLSTNFLNLFWPVQAWDAFHDGFENARKSWNFGNKQLFNALHFIIIDQLSTGFSKIQFGVMGTHSSHHFSTR